MPQKSDGVPSEAQRADNGSGVLRVEAASPLSTRKGLRGALQPFPAGSEAEPRQLDDFSVL